MPETPGSLAQKMVLLPSWSPLWFNKFRLAVCVICCIDLAIRWDTFQSMVRPVPKLCNDQSSQVGSCWLSEDCINLSKETRLRMGLRRGRNVSKIRRCNQHFRNSTYQFFLKNIVVGTFLQVLMSSTSARASQTSKTGSSYHHTIVDLYRWLNENCVSRLEHYQCVCLGGVYFPTSEPRWSKML